MILKLTSATPRQSRLPRALPEIQTVDAARSHLGRSVIKKVLPCACGAQPERQERPRQFLERDPSKIVDRAEAALLEYIRPGKRDFDACTALVVWEHLLGAADGVPLIRDLMLELLRAGNRVEHRAYPG
ncbi:hypothetical protein [Roseovarius ramblicola]|uniref:Uncharacterized protein n=1 Tax=Roseovarius ramblicola TaxID=2022336 RepID=A0ABV5I132_9RHOB